MQAAVPRAGGQAEAEVLLRVRRDLKLAWLSLELLLSATLQG